MSMEELVDKKTSADECQTHLHEFAIVFANSCLEKQTMSGKLVCHACVEWEKNCMFEPS